MPTESPEVTIPDTPAPAAPTSERQDRDTRLTAIRPPTRFPRLDVRELWAFRELLGIFVWRDLKVRYKQTFVGAAWAVFQPILVAAVYTIVFGRFAKFPSGTVYYPVFVFAGILPWQYFASSVSSGATVARVEHQPRHEGLLPTPAAARRDRHRAGGRLRSRLRRPGGLMVIWGPTPSWPDILVAPAFLGLAVVTAVGVVLWLSAVNVRYRDVPYAIPVFLQVLPLLSGVPFAIEQAPVKWQWLLALNPMTARRLGLALGGPRLGGAQLGSGGARRDGRPPARRHRGGVLQALRAPLRGHDLMTEVAITVEGLSKQYRIGELQASYGTLRDSLVRMVRDAGHRDASPEGVHLGARATSRSTCPRARCSG